VKSRSYFCVPGQITCLVSGGAGVLPPASRAHCDQSSVHVGRAQPNRVYRAVRVISPPLPQSPRSVCTVVWGLSFVDRNIYLFVFCL
jgi:hypothetical protein